MLLETAELDCMCQPLITAVSPAFETIAVSCIMALEEAIGFRKHEKAPKTANILYAMLDYWGKEGRKIIK